MKLVEPALVEKFVNHETEESFASDIGEGALYIGSPETVANKIVTNLELPGASRLDLKFGMPGLTHDQVMTTIELYGTQVIPRVRELVGDNAIAAQRATESTRNR